MDWKTGLSVIDILCQKHPAIHVPNKADFDKYEAIPKSVVIYCFEENFSAQALHLSGSTGPIQANITTLQKWLLHYGMHSVKL